MKFKESHKIDYNNHTPGDNRLSSDVLIPPSADIARTYKPKKVRRLPSTGRISRKMPMGGLIDTDKRPHAERRPTDRPLRTSIFVPPEQMRAPWRVPEELHRIRTAYGMSMRAMAKMLGVNLARISQMSQLDPEGVPKKWFDADMALRIERLTGVSALDLMAMDAATKVWVLNRTDIHRQMLNLLPTLPTIMRRRPKETEDAAST